MPDVPSSELLIQSLLDGQLDMQQTDQAKAMLAADPALASKYEALRSQRQRLQQSPRFTPTAGFKDRVVKQSVATAISAFSATADSDDAATTPSSSRHHANEDAVADVRTTRSGFQRWQIVATALASSAATLVLALLALPGVNDRNVTASLKSDATRTTAADANGVGREVATPPEPAVQEVDAASEMESAPLSPPLDAMAFDAASDFDDKILEGSEILKDGEIFKGDAGKSRLARDIMNRSPVPSLEEKIATAELPNKPLVGTPAAAGRSANVIEQVWLLESQDGQSQAKLNAALVSNAIEIAPPAGDESMDAVDLALEAEVDGILVEASSRQMMQALIELADSDQFAISAFPLGDASAHFSEVERKKRFALQQLDARDRSNGLAPSDRLAKESRQPAAGAITKPNAEVNANAERNAYAAKSMPMRAQQQVESDGLAMSKTASDSNVDSASESAPADANAMPAMIPIPRGSMAQQLRGRRFLNYEEREEASTVIEGSKLKPEALLPARKYGAGMDGMAMETEEFAAKGNAVNRDSIGRDSISRKAGDSVDGVADLFPDDQLNDGQKRNFLIILRNGPNQR